MIRSVNSSSKQLASLKRTQMPLLWISCLRLRHLTTSSTLLAVRIKHTPLTTTFSETLNSLDWKEGSNRDSKSWSNLSKISIARKWLWTHVSRKKFRWIKRPKRLLNTKLASCSLAWESWARYCAETLTRILDVPWWQSSHRRDTRQEPTSPQSSFSALCWPTLHPRDWLGMSK